MNPTAEQLAARLNPTASTVNVPTAGLYRMQGDFGTQLFDLTNGKSFDLLNAFGGGTANGNAGGQASAAVAKLKSDYGIDFNSLPTFDYGGYIQNKNMTYVNGVAPGKIYGTGGYQFQNAGTDPNSFFAAPIGPAASTSVAINTTQNALGPGVQPGVQPALTGPAATAATGATALPNNGGAPPAAQPAVDYTLHPGESIAQYNARIASGNSNLPAPGTTSPSGVTNTATAAPQPTSIPSTLTPPTSSGGTYTPPTGNAAADATQYTTSLTTQLASLKATLDASYQSKISGYQSQIDALNKQQADATNSESSVVSKETTDKQAALATEQKQFQDQYDAKQALINEMDGLLTTGNQVIEQMKATTGLSSIMSPRISQTMTDVAARAGIINSLLSARDGQISAAQAQLRSSTDAITSIAKDQIDYYNSIIDASKSKITSLTSDQKTYIDAQIQQQQDTIKTVQTNVDAISKAMLDPTTADAFNRAGVSLTDSPAQINAKLATYGYATELSDNANKMAAAGYSSTPIAGVTPVTTTDTHGVQKNWYKEQTSGGFTIGNTRFDANGNVIVSSPTPAKPSSPSSSDSSKGTMSNAMFVNVALTRAGISYPDALAKIPSGKVGVVDNATGQVGYIDLTEYNTKTYTLL
jgi:gas vesicle protein